MNNYNTFLGQLLDPLKRPEFQKIIKMSEADKFCKGFDTMSHLTAMSLAQLVKPNGLRNLANELNDNKKCFYHLGIKKEIARSTIAYANENRSCEVFELIFHKLLESVTPQQYKKIKKDLQIIDATTISLNVNDFSWAKFRETKAGIKMNVKLDYNKEAPTVVNFMNAVEHEKISIEEMKLKTGDTVAFDRGYFDFELFAELSMARIAFVTRLKAGVKYKTIEEKETKHDNILYDKIIRFTSKKAQTNDLTNHRIIKCRDEKTGKSIVVLTNDLKSSAKTIAQIYRARWQIETFFKMAKQNLKITKFYGQSENAVKTQIWIALIVYVLYLLLRQRCEHLGKINEKNKGKSFSHFMSEIALFIFVRKSLEEWFCGIPPTPKIKKSLQCVFDFYV